MLAPAVSTASGNVYKWDSVSQQYIYNWSTKELSAGYWYKISAKLDDGNIYSVVIGLKYRSTDRAGNIGTNSTIINIINPGNSGRKNI